MNKPESDKTYHDSTEYLLSLGAISADSLPSGGGFFRHATIDSLCNAGGFIPYRAEPDTDTDTDSSTGTDSTPEHTAGLKYDSGKQLAGILYEDFPHALSGVADVATFGARKYTRNGWRTVPNGLQRYTDAMHRHLLAAAKGEVCDPESGLPHLHHVAWNALAIAELTAMEPKP